MTVPYTFAAFSGSIPLSYLDSNFATTITMGNTAVQLGDTITTFNNVTLASPTITSPSMSGVTISSGNVTATTITATTGTFSGNVQMASVNGGQLAGLRNKIINGDMNINQRNATAQALTNPGAYSLDRWYGRCSGTASGTITIGQQAYVINVGSSNQTLRLSKTAGTYAGTLYAAQPLETANSYGLAGKQVTISFRARFGATYTGATPTVTIVTGTGTNQSAETMITAAWTGQVSQSVTLTGTLSTTFSTFYGTVTLASGISQVGVLFGAVYTATTGSTNDYLDITEVQLEVGPVATPFEQLPYGMELALCQRYFVAGLRSSMSGVTAASTTQTVSSYFPVEMRTTPTMGTPSFSTIGSIGTLSQSAYNSKTFQFNGIGTSASGFIASLDTSASAEM